MDETEVLVVGAGPTGLTLAIDLAHRGIRTLLVERHERPLARPDLHVCWRGDSAPSNFAEIAATVTGWGTAPC